MYKLIILILLISLCIAVPPTYKVTFVTTQNTQALASIDSDDDPNFSLGATLYDHRVVHLPSGGYTVRVIHRLGARTATIRSKSVIVINGTAFEQIDAELVALSVFTTHFVVTDKPLEVMFQVPTNMSTIHRTMESCRQIEFKNK